MATVVNGYNTSGSCYGAGLIGLLRATGAFLNYLTRRLRKGPQMFVKYAGMTMEERDPIVTEWAKTIRVDEVPVESPKA